MCPSPPRQDPLEPTVPPQLQDAARRCAEAAVTCRRDKAPAADSVARVRLQLPAALPVHARDGVPQQKFRGRAQW